MRSASPREEQNLKCLEHHVFVRINHLWQLMKFLPSEAKSSVVWWIILTFPAESISRFTLRRLMHSSWESSSYQSGVCQEQSVQTTLILFDQISETHIPGTQITWQSGSSASNLYIFTSASTTFQHTDLTSVIQISQSLHKKLRCDET